MCLSSPPSVGQHKSGLKEGLRIAYQDFLNLRIGVTEIDIQQFITTGEMIYSEFKSARAHSDALAAALVSDLNAAESRCECPGASRLFTFLHYSHFLFNGRLEVHSPGRLPSGVTIDNIRFYTYNHNYPSTDF